MSKLKLDMGQRLRISMGHHVPIGKQTRPGWSGSLMFYAFKCPKHGIVTNYVGCGRNLKCPKCREDKP